MSTKKIINNIKQAQPDYNNMRTWSGFLFGKNFNELDISNFDVIESEQRKQYFFDYRSLRNFNIDIEEIGTELQLLYPDIKFDIIPQVAYAECKTNWDLGAHTHENEIALHMTVFLNKDENEGLYVHNTDENFYEDAVYVKNIYDSCCVFPFTGKQWHGIKGQNIKGTRKLLYIDWMKNDIVA
jgi:hypothetical protein|tara:strand:+ start:13052 stop:13600 length:549 start_codon:yes stop_codon:yes gene_type:complete